MSSVRFQITELHRQMPPSPVQTNQEAISGWAKWAGTKLKQRTLVHYRQQLEMFAAAFGGILVTALEEQDIQHYLDQYEARGCNLFQSGSLPKQADRCRSGHDLAQCGVLIEGAACPFQKRREAGTTLRHLNALNHFFRYLRVRRHVPNNPIPEIRLTWQAENRHLMGRRIEPIYTGADLHVLLQGVKKPHIRFLFILLLKTGVRIGEALALTTEPSHFNLAEGWMKIPCIGEKRCGYHLPCDGKRNHYVIIDEELDLHLRLYLRWRRGVMKRFPGATRLLVGPNTPTPTYNTLYKLWGKPTMQRLGLYETTNGPRRLFHSFRHTFTTMVRANGCDDGWTEVLRGCLPPGNLATYHHPSLDEIRDVYAKVAPKLPA